MMSTTPIEFFLLVLAGIVAVTVAPTIISFAGLLRVRDLMKDLVAVRREIADLRAKIETLERHEAEGRGEP